MIDYFVYGKFDGKLGNGAIRDGCIVPGGGLV